MNNKPYVLYLGGIFSEETMLDCPAVSPAANRWQKGLISGMQRQGERVELLGHLPEPLWPRGRLMIDGNTRILHSDISGRLISYMNLPLFRTAILKYRYIEAFRQMCRNIGPPRCVVSYNLYPQNMAVGQYAQNELNIPWIPIIADVPDTIKEREIHDRVLGNAAGRVFLSWGAYKYYHDTPKMHLDGGVLAIRNHNEQDRSDIPLIIFFSGAMNKWAGVDLLLEAFALLKRNDVQLWLCGKNSGETVIRAAESDRRITYFGCVEESRLVELSMQATIMVNPRPSSLPENRFNFPSKVLEYLSYCKPVISTWTEGLSPEYRNVLLVLDDDSPETLVEKINDVLTWNDEQRVVYTSNVVSFLQDTKTWDSQANRFSLFLEESISSWGRQ